QPQVQVQDGAGNNVSANAVAITASITSGTGGSLGGNTIAITNANGLATFTNLALSGTAGNFTLGFAATGLTGATSSTVALTAGTATVLAITTQPSPSVQSGVDFPQQPVVQLRDGDGNPVAQAGIAVSVTIQSGGGTLGGTTTVNTNLSGQAVFTNLRITGVIGDRVLLFGSPGYVGVSSNTVTVTAGAAAALQMVTQPSGSAQSGVPFPVQPSVRLVDQNGNAVSQTGVSVAAAMASGGGSLGGTTTVTTDGTGLAQFTNLAITGTPGPQTLSFASAGLTGTTSATISLAAGPASQLTLTTPPSSTATNGQPLAQQPTVQLRDGAGTAVAQAGVTVTAVIATSPGGTPGLAGGSAITDANGLATFSGLTISGTVGSYTLRFESGALTPVTSGGITLAAGAASQLTLTTQPSTTAQNTVAFPQQPVVQLRDAGGNAVSQSGVTVTATIASGTGTLGGTTSVATDGSGVAAFTNLSLTGTVGTFTLQFSATGLTSVTSGTITLAAGPPASLVMFREPPSTATSGVAFPNPPTVVRVLDANGNDVNGATVTASIASGPGGASLVGSATAISGSNGQAGFSGLGILGLVGNYTLGFSTPGATGVTSTAIALSAGAAAKLALTTSPSPTVRNALPFPVQPVVQIQDAAGNPLSPNGTPVTAAITSGGGTLGGTASVNTSAGAAAFTNLMITGTIGARTLTFSSGSLTPVSSGVSVLAGTATAIAIVTQPPASVPSGATMAASVVDLRDVSGNDVDSAGVSVTVTIATGGGTLGGTPSQVTGGNGQASFGDLSITGTPGIRTLSYSGTGLTAATSNNVNVTAPAATQLAITTQPSPTARSGIALGTVPVVQARDASNNPVS
ncbi:MAG TPA: carboxypeptidase-like regulatory domain-containing protein, partial [Gemmatimonadales bacterium]